MSNNKQAETVGRLSHAIQGCSTGARYFFRNVNGKQQKVICPKYKWEQRQAENLATAKYHAEKTGYEEKAKTIGTFGKKARLAATIGVPIAAATALAKLSGGFKNVRHLKSLVEDVKGPGSQKLLKFLKNNPRMVPVYKKARKLLGAKV